MDGNRAKMRCKLADLQEERRKLTMQANGHCERIGELTNHLLADIEEMDIAQAAMLMDQLVMTQAELLSLRTRITDLEQALYG